jgi:hypothetical protein
MVTLALLFRPSTTPLEISLFGEIVQDFNESFREEAH